MLKNYSAQSNKPLPTHTADCIRKKLSGKNADDEALIALCCRIVFDDPEFFSVCIKEKLRFVRKVYCCLRCDLETLQDIADDPGVSEIMVNGYDSVFIERNGHIEKVEACLDSKKQLIYIIQRLAAKVGREMNDLNPIVDARLSDGSRINAVNDNIAIGGPILTIRKFTGKKMSMEDLIEREDITERAAVFLSSAVRCGCNIFVSGGTSSGKTSFLNILSDFIPPSERIIVIEDSAELQIRGHENVIRMEAKAANSQGKGAISIKDLIKTSLRMRPDRIIVGEVRGDEVSDMLAAMSTGHDGSLSTGHANSPRGILGRLETLLIAGTSFPLPAVRDQIARALDLIVQLKRFPGGYRRVVEICEVCDVRDGEIQLNCLFERKDGTLRRTENRFRAGDRFEELSDL